MTAGLLAGLPENAAVTLGADPGGTAGFGLGAWDREQRRAVRKRAWQCDGDSAVLLLSWILFAYKDDLDAVQIERWDDRPGKQKLRGTDPAKIRRQVHEMEVLCLQAGVPVVIRTASQMKNWVHPRGGSDRLEPAGVADIVSAAAMIHARSGMGHALFTACHDCGLADPLSRRSSVPG